MNRAGSCDLATLTSAINLDRFVSGQDNVQGFMHVSVSIPTLQKGFCAVTGDLGAASAIGGAIPGIGGVVGGVFGLISAACSLANSAKIPAGQCGESQRARCWRKLLVMTTVGASGTGKALERSCSRTYLILHMFLESYNCMCMRRRHCQV